MSLELASDNQKSSDSVAGHRFICGTSLRHYLSRYRLQAGVDFHILFFKQHHSNSTHLYDKTPFLTLIMLIREASRICGAMANRRNIFTPVHSGVEFSHLHAS